MNEQARILIVDDDESIRESLSTVLKGAGYLVDTAHDGKEAIRKCNDYFYNLVLIDIRLPDMEGTELLTAIKETIPKTVKIILTGYPSLQNAVEAVNKGADGYLIKPADTMIILSTVKEQLRKQQEAAKYAEEKVKEFIETRLKQMAAQEPKQEERQ